MKAEPRRPRILSPLVAGLLVSATLAAGCTDAAPSVEPAVRTDSAGVTIVAHGGSDVPAPLAFHEEFRLGGSDTRPEEAFFQVTAWNVAIDDAGHIHVLDPSVHRVHVFDGDGGHLRSHGGPGEGPGELGMPTGLTLLGDGGFGVMDLARGGVARFGPDGEPDTTLPFPSGFAGGRIHVTEAALVAPVRRPIDDGARFDSELVEITDGDTVALARVEGAEARPIQLESCGMSFGGMEPVFSPTLRWAARSGTIAATTSGEYDVVILQDGREVLRIRRDIPPRPATADLAIEEQGEGMQVRLESGTVVCDPAEVVEQRGVAPVIPAVSQIQIAPDGTVWVRRGGVRGEPRPTDLFTADGGYLGTLPADAPFPIAFFPDGRIAAAEEDEFGVTRLVVYSVEEG